MYLTDYVHTFGRASSEHYGQRVHKLALNAAFTCPNRDGSKGRGGCTFCNNSSFSPNARQPLPIAAQIEAGPGALLNHPAQLRQLYDSALAEADVIGLSVGTRPDCVPGAVLDLLADYQARGFEVWLELGLQSSFDKTLQAVNRGHGYAEYRHAVKAARARGLRVCTHLIVGLPGETARHSQVSLERVLTEGVDGLKLHPLHVVKGTQLANTWRRGDYQPLTLDDYIHTVADMVELTPPEIIYHRLTGTASASILLAPGWCSQKWGVLNGIAQELQHRGTKQGRAREEKQVWNQ